MDNKFRGIKKKYSIVQDFEFFLHKIINTFENSSTLQYSILLKVVHVCDKVE